MIKNIIGPLAIILILFFMALNVWLLFAPDPEVKVVYCTPKYTVWLGSSVIAKGIDTDSYKEKKGMIEYQNCKSGIMNIVPKENIYKIEVIR